MVEQVTAEKKVWVAPALDELSIDQTLGGSRPSFYETQILQPGNVSVPNFGSIPNP